MSNGDATGNGRGQRLQPRPVRILHWLNAIAILVMIGSGWTIYNDQPLFSWLRFPQILSLGGEPATSFKLHGDGGFGGALLWHFAAMWLLVLNGFVYLGYGFATGHFRRKFLPIRLVDVVAQARAALHFRLPHDDIRTYNAVQKLLYVGILLAIVVQVVAGLGLWKPVQFSALVWLCFGFQGIRLVHFLGMMVICAFLLVHVALALIVPRTIVAMVTGGPTIEPPDQLPPRGVPLSPRAGAY